jgi:CheY-like chemotaxis protein
MSDDVPRRTTVLIVEDEPGLRELMVEELIDAGFEVLDAEIGHAAVAIIDSGRPIDVLFTDIRLPGVLDGWQIAQHAREVYPAIHVIYASGYSGDLSAQVPNSLYVRKPYLPAAIIAEITGRLGA